MISTTDSIQTGNFVRITPPRYLRTQDQRHTKGNGSYIAWYIAGNVYTRLYRVTRRFMSIGRLDASVRNIIHRIGAFRLHRHRLL